MMIRKVLALTLLFPLTAFAAIERPNAADLSRSAAATVIAPGVVADPASGRVFFMHPGGGIDATDLATGRALFTTKAADKPLGLWGRLLVAQKSVTAPGSAAIVLIDTTNPADAVSIDLSLPNDFTASVDEGLKHAFQASSTVNDGELFVSWAVENRWASPMPPPPGAKLDDVRRGAARIDLAARRAVAVPLDLAERLAPEMPEAAKSFAARPTLFGPPIQTGNVYSSTETSTIDGKSRITLKRWNAKSGALLPDVTLFSGNAILQLPSADGRHLLISERVAPGDWNEYSWSIFSLETGKLVGKTRNHDSHGRFFVAGTVLVHDSQPYTRRQGDRTIGAPRQVRGVDLATGDVAWTQTLRDIAFHGPYPS